MALEHKSLVRPDILPSGHCIPQNTKIILFFYSTGRMRRIWGKDCLEFKPKRWISKRYGIKHEPSFKFPAFNAGPRTCIGKEISFVQMKIVAATMIYNYHVQLVEDQSVSPSDSIIIQMKHGLKVKSGKSVLISGKGSNRYDLCLKSNSEHKQRRIQCGTAEKYS
ncbi:unnamed protein product [Fraxinus pennsylvanica]|uniref:Cytochrome P450 n=1 Tax=Fraxinus pennsylvanica TaxID=56036 RepID=A0AAD1ZP38_9LAMI|nr:unnamed protein product [Fraxinus pennsylvanica]